MTETFILSHHSSSKREARPSSVHPPSASAFITTRFSATSYKDQAKPQSCMILLTGRQLTSVPWWRTEVPLLSSGGTAKPNQNLALALVFRLSVEAKLVFDQTESESGFLMTLEVWNLDWKICVHDSCS